MTLLADCRDFLNRYSNYYIIMWCLVRLVGALSLCALFRNVITINSVILIRFFNNGREGFNHVYEKVINMFL